MPTALERDFSTEKRAKLAKSGAARPDGSFPIENCSDVSNAVRSWGRGGATPADKSHIIKRARALGCTDNLPDDWVGRMAKESIKGHDIFLAAEARDFDDEKMEAVITIVKPGVSANNRNHRSDAIRRAVENRIWNNSPMFVDHAEDRKMPMKRSFNSLVSGITTTELGDDGRAIGHVRFFDREFYQKAKEAKDFIGVSMTTLFKGKQWKTQGTVFEEVDDYVKNISVDWVAFPAAGGAIEKFLPAFESEDDVDWEALTLEDLKQNVPELYAKIQKDAVEDAAGNEPEGSPPKGGGDSTPSLSEARVQQLIKTALEDRDAEWEKRREEEKAVRGQVTDFVNKVGLPQKMRGQVIDDLVQKGAFDEKVAQEAVDEAWEVLKDAGLPGPKIKGAGPSGTQDRKEGERDLTALEDVAPTMLALESAFGIAAGGDN